MSRWTAIYASSIAALLASFGGASAADLQQDAIVQPDPTEGYGLADVGVSDWTGFYAGVFAGYGRGSVDGEWQGSGDDGGGGEDPGPAAAAAVGLSGPVTPIDLAGGAGGGVVGYGSQFDSLYLGVEAGVALSTISGSELQYDDLGVLVGAEVTSTWLASFVARVGYIVTPDLLVFATGGIAAADVTLDVVASGLVEAQGSDRRLHFGPMVGLGAEYRLDANWSIGVEYRYAALGEAEYTDPSVVDGSATLSLDQNLVNATLRYRF